MDYLKVEAMGEESSIRPPMTEREFSREELRAEFARSIERWSEALELLAGR